MGVCLDVRSFIPPNFRRQMTKKNLLMLGYDLIKEEYQL